VAFAHVNGVVLHHQVDGPATKPALVFANSLGSDFRIWDEVVARLGGRFRFVRYDKRGHGLSEATPAPYALTDHVNDLAALLDHLDVKRAAVVGLSVGGMIAQGIAALRPDLVAALVLVGTGHKIGTEEFWKTRIDAVKTNGIVGIADLVLQRWFTPGYRTPENPDFVGYTNMLVRTPLDGYVGTCTALRDADLTESTRALKIPAICMVGDQDGSTPPDLVRSLAALIKGAEFHIIADAGHIPCVERPDAVAELIGTFLKTTRYA
jgi:3-oxoadipate enol-lactonase